MFNKYFVFTLAFTSYYIMVHPMWKAVSDKISSQTIFIAREIPKLLQKTFLFVSIFGEKYGGMGMLNA